MSQLSPLHKERIKKWVDTLRSGDYKQGTGQLYDNGYYCCLGVACEISGLGKWVAGLTKCDDLKVSIYITDNSWAWGTLPLEVSDYFGLPFSDPIVTFKDNPHCLSTLNDSTRLSFEEIADLIEETFLPE
jgi:hypothetical protein